MAILLNENSKVIVQGMTGSEGKKHTERMIKSGTKIVGGVTPGKGGQSLEVAGQNVPVFNSVQEAISGNWCKCFSGFRTTEICQRCSC
jgi:succinyl-CoA synthetase alpha subunit